jgi:hypothetical protein
MTANRPYDDDDLPGRGYVERRADPNRADREISLGTPTILGLFFVLALAFAAVFSIGYTMGHHSAPPRRFKPQPSPSTHRLLPRPPNPTSNLEPRTSNPSPLNPQPPTCNQQLPLWSR